MITTREQGQAVSRARWGGDRSRMVDRSLDILAASHRNLVPDQRERLARLAAGVDKEK